MITRNNYEEFFLLYVDNELSPAEREDVERFVEAHPDLREEWELLQQCRITPGEMPVFTGKELLLREEGSSLINLSNYGSWFLSCIDGELDETARQAVTRFIQQHPGKDIELQRLQQTVNIPDKTIVFPHKESLYRREERKIAWMPFVRIAAAALILGAIGLVFFHPFRKSGTSTPPIAGRPSSSPVTIAPSTPTVTDTASPEALLASAPEPVIKKHLAAVTPRMVDTLHLYKSKQPPLDNGPSEGTAGPALAKVDLPVARSNVGPSDNEPPVRSETIASVKMSPAINTPAGNHDLPKVITQDPKASFATQALLSHEVAYTEDGAMDETASPRKNKLRGLFRKVTRALEKPASRAEDDDRKVLIGGFQFALQ